MSSSVFPFLSHLQSFPVSGFFSSESALSITWPKFWVSAPALVLPMNTQDRSPLGWTGWISLQSKGLSRVFSNNHSSKASILWRSAFYMVQQSHSYMTTGKTIALTRWTFVGKVMSLLFNMLSRLVVNFLPRSSVQFSSVAQSCPALCDPMNHSTPGLPVPHQLPEFTQTHVHRVGDAI